MEMLHAPWTDKQVHALNRFQREGRMHPFTCGRPHHLRHPVLIATTDGWICAEGCGYTQTWAPSFMADPSLWSTP